MSNDRKSLEIIVETLSRYKNDPTKLKVSIRFEGLGISVHKTVTNEIISQLREIGISQEKAEDIMRTTLKKILNVLSNKIIENRAPPSVDSEGTLILDKLYDPKLRDKYLLMSTAVAPILDDIDIVIAHKSTDDAEDIVTYILKLKTLTLDGEYETKSIECSRRDLEIFIQRLKEKIGGTGNE